MTTYGPLAAHWFSLLVVASCGPALWFWGERAERKSRSAPEGSAHRLAFPPGAGRDRRSVSVTPQTDRPRPAVPPSR